MTAVVWGLPVALVGAAPDGPAPAFFGESAGPPPAWIETTGGDQWLTTRFERWCPAELGGVCAAEPIAALAAGGLCRFHVFGGVPEVRVAAGERVRFHLAAGVRAASLVRPGSADEVLTAAEVVDWTAPATPYAGRGALAAAFHAGAVSYRARFVVSTDRTGPTVRGLRPLRSGTRIAMAIKLSEPASVNGCIEPVARYGPENSRLYRRFPGVRLGRRAVTLRLGSLPRGRYLMRLLIRDASGNSTVRLAKFGANRGSA